MTLESFPIEYSMTGLRISATTSRIMWIDSASRRLRWAGSELDMERSAKRGGIYAASLDKATFYAFRTGGADARDRRGEPTRDLEVGDAEQAPFGNAGPSRRRRNSR